MRILGVYIDGSWLRAAVVEKRGKSFQVKLLKCLSANEFANVKELYMVASPCRVATGVASQHLLIRSLTLALPKSRHLEEAVQFQSDAVSPFRPEEVITVPQILSKEQQKTEILFYTALRQPVGEVLSQMGKIGLDPDSVSGVPNALVQFVQWKDPNVQDAFIIHLGFAEWSVVCMEKGRLKKSYSILGGNEVLLAALWEDRKKILLPKEVEGVAKQIDLLQLKSHLNPHLSQKLNEMKLELAKAIYAFHREGGAKSYVFTGCIGTFGYYVPFLAEGFADQTGPEIRLEDAVEYAVPIGWALEQKSAFSLQLRKEEFFPNRLWKQAGLCAVALFLTSFLLGGALLFWEKKSALRRNERMLEQLSDLLEDPGVKSRIFASSDAHAVLANWIQEASLYAKEYPYMAKAPKVSAVLAWLYSYPYVVIRDFQYELTQFPHIDAEDEPYQAKVEIAFETENPVNGRKFHQALLKAHEWIDLRHDVTWSILENGYRASFILKNREAYAP
ncbi:MAG: hypothetical protein HY069_01085 [Chlamydiia bacterium]|nr:hypothetical protein [Chlamydiia bacterium]